MFKKKSADYYISKSDESMYFLFDTNNHEDRFFMHSQMCRIFHQYSYFEYYSVEKSLKPLFQITTPEKHNYESLIDFIINNYKSSNI